MARKTNITVSIDYDILEKVKVFLPKGTLSNKIENFLAEFIKVNRANENNNVYKIEILEKKKEILEEELNKKNIEMRTINSTLNNFKEEQDKIKLKELEELEELEKNKSICCVCGNNLENKEILTEKGLVHIDCYEKETCGKVL